MLVIDARIQFNQFIDLILLENKNNHVFNNLGAINFFPIFINLIHYRFLCLSAANNPPPHMHHHAPL